MNGTGKFLQVVAALQRAGFQPLVMGGHAIRYSTCAGLRRPKMTQENLLPCLVCVAAVALSGRL